ncbi:sulfate transporter family-domain-containing protein [Umbelopsis sp. PMI_123]|nr:sulfate transporter family-domain-containing protein [Umbelopsis sp. PMI_123]
MSPTSSMVIDYDEPNYKESAVRFIHKLPVYTKEYFASLFPIFTWIHRYNVTWLVSDIIAGVTVGIVVVPQGMGYAKIAQLPPQYGLYSSFVGVCIYCIFGTSKDISIGPTAVMSLLVGQTITSVTASNAQYTGPEIAALLALFGGIVSVFIGLVRLGIIVDFIPNPAIAGFMTGSAITISIGQWPKLFGISGVNTQDSAYLIFGHFFQHLPSTKVDAAFGILGLIWLYSVRFGTQYLTKRYPKYEKPLFFCNIMRNGVLVIFGTLIAFLINIGKSTSPISILKTVPAGFNAMGVPKIETGLLSEVAGTLPSVVIILILEHVAIAKSFGRINDYKINPNQEIIAIGVANVFGSFFGAYPNTGSFSRTAIKARSGVRTPLAGIFSAAVVVLSLYALTPAFYYIPDAILAAVIIHAVSDLVSGPKFLKQLWHVNPLELGTFVCAVIITFFTSVEYGIYVSVALSIVILLVRIARPRYSVLGRIPLQRSSTDEKFTDTERERFIYVPQTHRSLREYVQPTPPGVICFRFDESLTYPNSGFISEKIIEYVRSNTRRGKPLPERKGDRAWNDNTNPESEADNKTVLKALVFDFSGVNNLDSTGVQMLLDVQLAINRYADRDVEWHFAGITSPSIRSALLAGGFGVKSTGDKGEVLPVVPAHKDGPANKGKHAMSPPISLDDLEYGGGTSSGSDVSDGKELHTVKTVEYCNDDKTEDFDVGVPRDVYPLFHWNVEEAVVAACKA